MSKSEIGVQIQRLDPDLPLPVPAHVGDAGLDLYAREDAIIRARGGRLPERTVPRQSLFSVP